MKKNDTGILTDRVKKCIDNLTPNERELFIAGIDEKMRKMSMEDILMISKKLNYVFPIDYARYYANQLYLPIKHNIFKFKGFENTKVLLLTMEENNENCVLKFINFDSQYSGKFIPFALLDDSNFLCFNRQDDSIFYYSNQNKTIEKLAENWDTFEKRFI